MAKKNKPKDKIIAGFELLEDGSKKDNTLYF